MALKDSIDWGTQAVNAGGIISVYFAGAGQSHDGITSLGWTNYEIQQAMAAFATFENVTDIRFVQVPDAASSDFQLVTTSSKPYLGYFNPPGTVNEGVGVFAVDGFGWNGTGGLEQGGYGFVTLIHEIGHGLGLAHPHDIGGSSSIMPGVASEFLDFGDHGLNQGVYTTMSYNDGWFTGPQGVSTADSYGYQGTPMGLDIAVLQGKYGANTNMNHAGTIYELPTTNQPGSFYQALWDTGGADTIVNNSSANATIDLRTATLGHEEGGGGFISYVAGVHGGFTIASGTIIEHATGGSGNDTLIGNSSYNALKGNAGIDKLDGGGGNDVLIGGAGADELNGNAGLDWARYDSSDASIFINLQANSASGGHAQGDTLIDIEYIMGSHFADTIVGNSLNNYFMAKGGVDIARGGDGNDYVWGEDGNDFLYGDGGNDQILSGEGSDLVDGGIGFDWARYTDSTLGVDVNLSTHSGSAGYAAGDTLTDIEYLYGSRYDDDLWGDAGNNYFLAWYGNDFLYGGNGSDYLNGGSGNDFISGGAGNDLLGGDAGIDTFYFDNDWELDTIRDFSNSDILSFDITGFTNVANLYAALDITQVGANTLINFTGDVTDTVTLLNYAATALSINDFEIA